MCIGNTFWIMGVIRGISGSRRRRTLQHMTRICRVATRLHSMPYSKKGKEKIIKDAAFEGRGCMICIAAASMLTEQVTGKKISVASRLKEKDILAFFGGELTASRANCALISYNALGKLLSQR